MTEAKVEKAVEFAKNLAEELSIEIDLEKVKSLAEKLSSEERSHLFHYLAELPDSDIHSSSLSEPPYELQENAESQIEIESIDTFILVSSPPEVTPIGVAVLLKGKTVFQVFYYPENFKESRMKVRSWKDAPPNERVKDKARSILSKMGVEKTEEEIDEAFKEASKQLYEAITFRTSNEIAARLPDMTALLVDASIKIIEINIEKSFAEQTGQQGKKLEDIEKLLAPYWKHIKEKQLGVIHGGSRARKSAFRWDTEKALALYQTVEALPRHGADKLTMWEYAREMLRDNDYDYETIQFLMGRPMFADVPEGLLKEAANVWRQYDESWDSLPPANSPLAFAFRHACHKLGYPEYAYNTLRTKYYEGKKASENKQQP